MKREENIIDYGKKKKKTGKKVALVVVLLIVIAVIAVLGSIMLNVYVMQKNPLLKDGYGEYWGDYDRVVEQFGEPDEKSDTRLVYYNDEYVELLNKLEKMSLKNSSYEEIAELNYQISTMIYQKTIFEFDELGRITYVYHDAKACNDSSEKELKEINIDYLDNIVKYYFNETGFSYTAEFTDGSYVKAYDAVAYCDDTEGEIATVTFSDDFYDYSYERPVVENPQVAVRLENGIYLRLADDGTVYVSGEGAFNVDDVFEQYGEDFMMRGDFNRMQGVSSSNVIFGSGITEINGYVSNLLYNFRNFAYIPESVNLISEYAFNGFREIFTESDNSKEGWAINKCDVYGVDECISDQDYIALITDGECYLHNLDSNNNRIPAEIKGYPVTELGKVSLGYDYPDTISIPEGIKVIRSSFWKSEYEKVVFSSTVEDFEVNDEIGMEIQLAENGKIVEISGCYMNPETGKLLYATDNAESIPDAVIIKEIAAKAFYMNKTLEKAILPDTVEKIGDMAFYGCTEITELVLPENLMYIGESAFAECVGITEAYIHKSTYYIGADAFYGTSIVSIYCELSEAPESWDSKWKRGISSVIWNYGGISGVTEDGFV